MIYSFLPLLFAAVFATPAKNQKSTYLTHHVEVVSKETAAIRAGRVYHALVSNCGRPAENVFAAAFEGFYNLKAEGRVEKDILTVVDFSLSSNQKRLWVIDLAQQKVLYNTLVAHGRNTGNEFANVFSNRAESNMSSLGFYATGEIYYGKHGKSLRLDGLQKGINDNARRRAVVIHGADYVSESFIKRHSRLGRSQGCPAIPVELTDEIIQTIKDKSCLYIYHPSTDNKKAVS